MTNPRTPHSGFTIIELLTAMAVMAVLAGMAMAALTAAESDARRTRAVGQIDRINAIVNEIYEREASRRFTLNSPAAGYGFFDFGSFGTPIARQQHASSVRIQLNRARLKLLRDWLRVSIPDRKTDLQAAPTAIQLTTYDQSNPGTTATIFADDGFRRLTRRERYRQRIFALTAGKAAKDGTTAPASLNDAVNNFWSDTHQDAECLYLMLASSTLAGGSAIESIRESEIGDTDADGVPEILDSWGQPIGFMRWPVGYWLTYPLRMETTASVRATALQTRIRDLGPDGTDFLRADVRFFSAPSGHDKDFDDPFNMSPIVFSAGSDGVFDLVTRWRVAPSGSPTSLNYAGMTFSGISGAYPDPYQGGWSGSSYNSVDYAALPSTPYTSGTATNTPFDPAFRNGLVGAYLDENADQVDNSVDNIFPRS